MASVPITSWEIDGETVETVSDFIFCGSKVTVDGVCSHEIKRSLLLGRKVMTSLDSILKSTDITLATKVRLVKAMFFQWSCMDVSVGLWRKQSAEELILFELWCWRRLLRVPWTARRSNQSILKISPGDFFGRNDAKAETAVLWPPHVKSWHIGKDSCWEGLGAGGEGDGRGWDGWMASLTRWMWVCVNSGGWW